MKKSKIITSATLLSTLALSVLYMLSPTAIASTGILDACTTTTTVTKTVYVTNQIINGDISAIGWTTSALVLILVILLFITVASVLLKRRG